MDGYDISDDGKIHTRFSELMRCTPKQIHSVLNDRAGLNKRFESQAMRFGTSRHDEFEAETLQTGRSPEVFKDSVGFDEEGKAEIEFATEIFPGVVLHSRFDFIGGGIVADYKTTTKEVKEAEKQYFRSIQIKVYAYQAMLHDIPVEKMIHLIEAWDQEYNNITGYGIVTKDFKPGHIKDAQVWLKKRATVLVNALRMLEESE